MPDIFGLSPSQYDRVGAMLHAYESGTLWPSDKVRNPPRDHQLAKVRFHNDSGETIPAYGCMRIADAAIDSEGVWRLTCRKPNSTLNRLYLVNSGYDVGVSEDWWGTFLWHGGHVLYDTANTPAYGEQYGPQDGTWTLLKNRPGFEIQGGTAGSGATARVVAVQRAPVTYIGKADASITKGSSGTVSIWTRNSAGTWADTGMDVTATALGAAVTLAKYCSVTWYSGVYLVSPWEC